MEREQSVFFVGQAEDAFVGVAIFSGELGWTLRWTCSRPVSVGLEKGVL